MCPKLDGPGQVYCRPTELWPATSPRQCSSGYAHPRDSGSLPSMGESFGAGEGVSPRSWPGPGTFWGCPEVDSRIPVPVANVVQSDIVAPRGVGAGCSLDAPLEMMSSLIARLLWAAQEDNPAEVKVPLDAGARRPSVMPEVGMPGRSQLSEAEQVMVCFSCGRPGHGVNRCSRVDTSFPFLPQGWSVDIRDGQYRVVWPGAARARSPPGNEGWYGREGQPPGSSGTRERLTPVEGSVLPRPAGANRHGSCWWGMSIAPVGLQAHKLFHHWGAIPQGYTDGISEGCRS